MADEEAPPAEEPPPEEAAPPPEEEAPPPPEEAAPAAEEPPAEAPPDEAPAETVEEAPAAPEDAAPSDAPPPAADEGQAPPAEEPLAAEPGEAPAETPQKEATTEEPTGEPDIMRDPEIEVLEAAGMIEEVHVIGQEPTAKSEEDAYDEGSMEGTMSREDDQGLKEDRKVSMVLEDGPDEVQFMDKSKSLMEMLKDSSMDIVTKKDLLEKKKQKVLGSVISIRRGDPTYFDRQKVPKFQNSYKLDSDKPFNHERVKQILQEVLEEALNELTYDPDKCSKQAKWASSAIRAKVKEQEYDRYKIICYVSIGEKLCQDIFMMLRFLWDCERDSYALYVHETMNLFAIGLCFGIYYE